MKFIACLLCLAMASCTNVGAGKNEIKIPGTPSSLEEVKKTITGRQYQVENIGFVQVFMGKEEPQEWARDMKDTSKHFRDYIADHKKFALHFINDSIVKLTDEKQSIQAMYQLEKDTSAAVNLDIEYESADFTFPGSSEPMTVTFTYAIKGLDNDQLFLETPYQYNRKKVVYLMK